MAAFKDKKNGSWYVQFRYTDWRGERQQKLKRGFATKKEAQAWEREFLMQKQADINMSFENFVALYEKDVKPKLKLNTWLSKEHIIRTKILPYFKKRKLSEITARDVIDWQNEIRQHTKSNGESYSPDYLKNVHTQLSCIFNHAIKYYGLQINPAAKAGNMGSEQTKEMLDFRDRRNCRLAAAAACTLLDCHRRCNAPDAFDVGLRRRLCDGTCVGVETFQITSLSFGKNDAEGKRRFS